MFERLQSSPDSAAIEAALWRAAVGGSEAAIETLYRRHGSQVYRFSLRMCGDTATAEEVTQEVFLALLRQKDTFDPSRAALATWLCGIARRQVWKHLERRQKDLPAGMLDLGSDENGDGQELEVESSEDDPAMRLTRKEAVSAVRASIENLSLPLREVILLCEFEEITYQEAAVVIGVPVGTIRSRLHRAKAQLAQLLRGEAVGKAKEGRLL
jgi:RNA polymerase sigma-70 factor (ECF subfamily)